MLLVDEFYSYGGCTMALMLRVHSVWMSIVLPLARSGNYDHFCITCIPVVHILVYSITCSVYRFLIYVTLKPNGNTSNSIKPI